MREGARTTGGGAEWGRARMAASIFLVIRCAAWAARAACSNSHQNGPHQCRHVGPIRGASRELSSAVADPLAEPFAQLGHNRFAGAAEAHRPHSPLRQATPKRSVHSLLRGGREEQSVRRLPKEADASSVPPRLGRSVLTDVVSVREGAPLPPPPRI